MNRASSSTRSNVVKRRVQSRHSRRRRIAEPPSAVRESTTLTSIHRQYGQRTPPYRRLSGPPSPTPFEPTDREGTHVCTRRPFGLAFHAMQTSLPASARSWSSSTSRSVGGATPRACARSARPSGSPPRPRSTPTSAPCVNKGYLTRPSRPRAIEVTSSPSSGASLERRPVRNVPLVGDVAAGTGVLAAENIDEVAAPPGRLHRRRAGVHAAGPGRVDDRGRHLRRRPRRRPPAEHGREGRHRRGRHPRRRGHHQDVHCARATRSCCGPPTRT